MPAKPANSPVRPRAVFLHCSRSFTVFLKLGLCMRSLRLEHPNDTFGTHFVFREDGTYDMLTYSSATNHYGWSWSLTERNGRVMLIYKAVYDKCEEAWSPFWIEGVNRPTEDCFASGDRLLTWLTCTQLLGDSYVVENSTKGF